MERQARYVAGEKIGGRYEVYRALVGGMGEVYLCLDLQTMQPYALKTFQQQSFGAKLREAFLSEVGHWVALEKHPNIVRCFYMDMVEGLPFMFLEWVEGDPQRGVSLRDWLRRGALDLRQSLDFIIDICRGLVHAQQKQPGIVHRDLKPDNVLVTQNRIGKITDFGLAKLVQDAGLEIGVNVGDSRLHLSNIGGTPFYMAPEQWLGSELDQRTDIYAIGCILFELLTGNPPYNASNSNLLQQQHLNHSIPELETNLPPSLNQLLRHCMAKTRDERPNSVHELLDELVTLYQQQFSAEPRPLSPVDQLTSDDYDNRALTYYKLGQLDKALADHMHAIEINPHDPIIFSNRGNTYAKLGRYESALADFAYALELNPTYAGALTNRGTVYAESGNIEAALADYSHALQLEPDLAMIYSNRAFLYAGQGQYQAALADCERAIQIDPYLSLAYYNRGLTHATMGNFMAALTDYDRSAELDPDHFFTYLNRGIAYTQLRQPQRALEDFNRAIQLDPNSPRPYAARGNIFLQLGKTDAALGDYQHVLKLDPNYANAYANIGAVMANQGREREALPYFEKAASLGHAQAARYAAQIKLSLKH